MYERLDKLREDVSRLEKRRDEAEERLKAAKLKLKEAEASQILADVGALKLSPEQVAQFLQLAASGQLPTINQSTSASSSVSTDTVPKDTRSSNEEDTEEYDDDYDKIEEDELNEKY